MNESLIRKALTQILSALGYLHRSGVIYKNLIPSKVLVYNKEFDKNDIQIKLGDLINNTEIFSKKNYIYNGYENLIQDPLFIAPEYLEKKYNHKVDIWGVGMLAYLLFVGRPPFRGPKHKIIYQIANNNIEYPIDLDEIKKSLLQKMLAKNPNERYDADSLLKEEYFHQELDENMDESMDEAKTGKGFLDVVNSISTLTVGKNLRKSAMSYIIARKLYNENDLKLRKIFEALDSDHSGYIDKKELMKEYNKYFPGTTKKQLKVINNFLETADVDNNGKIDYAEFLTAMNLGNKDISKNTLKEVFDYYDHDKNGVIEAKDIKEIFEDTGLSDKEIHDLIDEIDLNNDRQLSFEEFYKLITAAI
jgi:calcium-dependent protein kinase